MSNSSLQVKKDANERHFRRARVALKGALKIPGLGVEMVCTNNISEGGIGLNTSENCEIAIGSDVQLHLKGVVSSEDNPRLETYAMKVIHVNGCYLGLSFA